jgi:uncharacterized delta-60 repeat protein
MKKIFSALFVFCFFKLTLAQPGTLDKSFGNNGTIISETYGGTAKAVAIQQDGKIIAVGDGGYGTTGGFLAVRYFSNGTLDSSFGDKGRALIEFQTIDVVDCAIQQDGKLLVAGSIATNNPDNNIDIAITRFNSDGTIDKGFGEDGKVISSIGNADYLTAISVTKTGKIIASGYVFHINGNDTAFLLQYNESGKIDSSFANKGVFEFTNGGDDLATAGQTIDEDGNI